MVLLPLLFYCATRTTITFLLVSGEESKCLIPLVSNFDPLLRDFDKVHRSDQCLNSLYTACKVLQKSL